MNKNELKKNLGHSVKLRPMAKRFAGGPEGPQLPPVDDEWMIQGIDQQGVRISRNNTHSLVLGFDHIREFTTDPARGGRDGILILKSQVSIGGNSMWVEPIGPWTPPDQFANVQNWKREDDGAYLQSLRPPPLMTAPQANNGNPFGFLAFLCVGALLLASD